AAHRRHHPQVGPDAALGVERRASGEEAEAVPDAARPGQDVVAADGRAARGLSKQPDQDAQDGGLAGAGRPQEPQRLPGWDREGQVVDRRTTVEQPGQPLDVDQPACILGSRPEWMIGAVASTVIAIGDELLAGFTLDTNSNWLA